VVYKVADFHNAFIRAVSSETSVEVWVKYSELARLQHAPIVLQSHSEVTAADLTELPPTCSAFSEWSYKVN